MTLRAAADYWRKKRLSPALKRTMAVVQTALLAAVTLYLLYRLSRVGWGEVVGSLPQSPWFYVLFALRYFALPLSEIPAYELVWGRGLWAHFPAFLRKRVYNYSVLGYSGEAFFTLWARRRLDISDRDLVVGVKDNNLLSALASNGLTVVLVAVLALSGSLATLNSLPGAAPLFSLAFASALALSFGVIVFRGKLISLPEPAMRKLIGVHGARVLLVMLLQAGMYVAAMPEAPLLAWFVLIALQLALSRIPLTPNQDLVYLSAALHLAPLAGASEGALAGMLVAEAGLSQLLNVVFFFLTAHLAKPQIRPSAA